MRHINIRSNTQNIEKQHPVQTVMKYRHRVDQRWRSVEVCELENAQMQ
jgi:DNA integrity scanning protein DisA with diadenylate cyclase activity